MNLITLALLALLALGLSHISTIHGRKTSTPTTQSNFLTAYRNEIIKQQQLSQRRILQSSICSCSPRSFTITLDLSNSCNINTVNPNSGIRYRYDPNSGIAGTDCDIEVSDNHGNHIPNGDTIPTVITSVSLIEFNPAGAIINVDDQYTNVNFVTGSSFDLKSISSSLSTNSSIEDQLQFVPSRAVLFMIGQNANGEEVVARFVLIFSNSCGGVAIEEGGELAWIVWSGVEEQFSAFCLANSPALAI